MTSSASLRHFTVLYAVSGLALVPAVCLITAEFDAAVYVGFFMLLIAVSLFCWSAKHDFGVAWTLITLFSVVAAIHAAIGFLLVGRIGDDTWASTALWTYYPRAFLIVAAGLLSASMGYCSYACRLNSLSKRLWSNVHLDNAKLLRAALWLSLIGTVVIFVVYADLGYMPALLSNAGQARYLTEDVSDSYVASQWLVYRALDLLTIALPLLIWNYRRSYVYRLAAFAGIISCLLPLRRAPFLVIAICLGAMEFITRGRIRKRYTLAAAVLLVVYGASQLLFLPTAANQEGAQRLYYAAAASATEVRDLAWMMSVSKEPWYGVTLLQPLIPLPSFLGDFSQKYKLSEVTIRLMQVEDDRKIGGLRLTLAGEAYLNFGYLGVAVLGFLFGLACKLIDGMAYSLEPSRRVRDSYWVALLFASLCFWIYLSGSGMAAALKMSALLAIFLFSVSRIPRDAAMAATEGVVLR